MNQEEKVELIDRFISNLSSVTFGDMEEIAGNCERCNNYLRKQFKILKDCGYPVKSLNKVPVSSLIRIFKSGSSHWRQKVVTFVLDNKRVNEFNFRKL